jgi:hypothetical protein
MLRMKNKKMKLPIHKETEEKKYEEINVSHI